MVSVDQAYMVGHMKNADGSINNKNVVLSAACEAAELFQCMMSVNQKLEDWQRFNHTLEQHLRSVECEKIHDICQAVYGMKHPSDELEGLYLAREDEQICLLYYQVFVGMLEININSAEVLYKQKEETLWTSTHLTHRRSGNTQNVQRKSGAKPQSIRNLRQKMPGGRRRNLAASTSS